MYATRSDEAATSFAPTMEVEHGSLWNAAARWLAHGDVRELAEAVQGGGKIALRAMFPKPSPDLAALAGAFSALQDARHEADYNHDYDIARPAALSLVRQASAAVDTADRMRAVGDPSYLLFLRLMVGSVKIAKSR